MHLSYSILSLLSLLFFSSVQLAFATTATHGKRSPLLDLNRRQPSSTALDSSKDYSLLTNAQRLARGLPLSPPVARHPTRVGAARRATSPLPVVYTQGYIALGDPNNGNDLFGWVASSLSGSKAFTYVTGTATGSRLIIQLDVAALTAGQGANIFATNVSPINYQYVGLVSSGANADVISPGSNYAFLAGTDPTPVGSTPVQGDNSIRQASPNAGTVPGMESAVWYVDRTTTSGLLHLALKWVNPSGVAVNLMYGYHAPSNSLVAKYDTTFLGNLGPVTYLNAYFVPLA